LAGLVVLSIYRFLLTLGELSDRIWAGPLNSDFD
jgi:hypothetical protein